MADADVMLQEAIEAIHQGQRARARDLLTRLLRANQNNWEYWLWMSSVVETPKEQVFCLQSVLRMNPENRIARQGLVMLGALPPEGTVTPAPPVRRKWEVEAQAIPKRRFWENPYVRIAAFATMGFVALGLIIAGIIGLGRRPTQTVAFIPTKTPGPSPTFTYTPTPLNYTPPVPTATPTIPAGPPPLWTLLDATYTPTPIYVITPRASNEAYSIAIKAYLAGDFAKALQYFQQAAQMSPDAADISFYMGEIYRAQKDYKSALDAYNQAIDINPDFAPSYLGRARATLALRPRADVLADLQAAVAKDPNYGEAQLELSAYLLKQGKVQDALKQLQTAEQVIPGTPMVYYYEAQAYLQLKDYEHALEYARKAKAADMTILPVYSLLAQAALANDQYQEALDNLKVYLEYAPDDAAAWMTQGEALYETQEYSQTIQALNQALSLSRNLPDAYLYRGLAYLELGDGQKAINDIFTAQQSSPESFLLSISMGRALLVANRLGDVLPYLTRAEHLAETDAERAQVYYYRATLYETIGNIPTALKDWQALVALPAGAVPANWLAEAKQHIKTTSTPAPTLTRTPTITSTPKATATPKTTATPKITGTPATPTPTPIPTSSAQPGSGATPTPTPTPIPTSSAQPGSGVTPTPTPTTSGTPGSTSTPGKGTPTPTPTPT